MTPQELLESGLLETVAMGLGSEAEAQEVLAARRAHAEVEAAWQQLAADLEIATAVYSRPAPKRSFTAVMDAIAFTEQLPSVVNISEEPSAKEVKFTPSTPANVAQQYADASTATEAEGATVVSISGGKSWALAASVTIAILSAVANIILYAKLQTTQDLLAQAETKTTVLTASFKKVEERSAALEGQLAMAADPAMPRIMLKGMNDAQTASTLVVWDPGKKMVQLSSKNLPAVPSDKDLQLWAIVAGKPVDLGIIKMEGDQLVVEHAIPELGAPQAFAITLETKGGNPQPLGTMWLMGEVKG